MWNWDSDRFVVMGWERERILFAISHITIYEPIATNRKQRQVARR